MNVSDAIASLDKIKSKNEGILKQGYDLGLYKPRIEDNQYPGITSAILNRIVEYYSPNKFGPNSSVMLRSSAVEALWNVEVMTLDDNDKKKEFEKTRLFQELKNLVIVTTKITNPILHNDIEILDRNIENIITLTNAETLERMRLDFNICVTEKTSRATKCLGLRLKSNNVSRQWHIHRRYLSVLAK